MDLPENSIITIKGTMEQQGQRDSVELMTRGHFTQRNGNYYITYAESEATGFQGCTTTVKVAEDASCVSMLRHGTAPSQLIIQKGVRHLCHYETGYGAISLGVAADEISHSLTADGGQVDFSYILDSGNEELLSRNLVHLVVRPLQNSPERN